MGLFRDNLLSVRNGSTTEGRLLALLTLAIVTRTSIIVDLELMHDCFTLFKARSLRSLHIAFPNNLNGETPRPIGDIITRDRWGLLDCLLLIGAHFPCCGVTLMVLHGIRHHAAAFAFKTCSEDTSHNRSDSSGREFSPRPPLVARALVGSFENIEGFYQSSEIIESSL